MLAVIRPKAAPRLSSGTLDLTAQTKSGLTLTTQTKGTIALNLPLG